MREVAQEARDEERPLVAGAAPWHLVGPLQRNKAKLALEHFDLVETIDRPEIADRLETLLAALKEARQLGGDIRLAAAQAGVEKVLKISGFMSILKFYPSVDEALTSFSG